MQQLADNPNLKLITIKGSVADAEILVCKSYCTQIFRRISQVKELRVPDLHNYRNHRNSINGRPLTGSHIWIVQSARRSSAKLC